MPFIENINRQFILSGVSGKYVFEQNPEKMDIIPPLQKLNSIKTLEGNDVYQQVAPFDNETRTMEWSRANQSLYANLKVFSNRDINNNIQVSYLWDGPVLEMQGIQVKVLDIHGEPIKGLNGNYDWNIKLYYKPVQATEKHNGIIATYTFNG